jgi:enamine deaminase RidA (YjgF/YER057c/UK114 family)
MDDIEHKLAQLGYRLPAPITPQFDYVPVTLHAGIAYVSGQLPRRDATTVVTGKLGQDVELDLGREAAQLCVLHGLSALKGLLGTLDRVERILKLTGFVASAPGFTQQPQVIDAASRLLREVFGESGRHARSAIGVAELPRGAAVEIEMVVAVREVNAQAR